MHSRITFLIAHHASRWDQQLQRLQQRSVLGYQAWLSVDFVQQIPIPAFLRFYYLGTRPPKRNTSASNGIDCWYQQHGVGCASAEGTKKQQNILVTKIWRCLAITTNLGKALFGDGDDINWSNWASTDLGVFALGGAKTAFFNTNVT